MSIRLKVLGAVMITFAVLLLAIYGLSRQVLEQRFRDLEAPAVQDSVQRALNALGQSAETLAATVIDWAHWDETYNFVQEGDPSYIEANFLDVRQVLGNLNADFVIITDTVGTPVLTYGYNFERERPVEVSDELLDVVNDIAGSEAFQESSATSTTSGFVRTSRRLVIMAMTRVLPTTRVGDSVGTFTFGRFLSDAEITSLSESLRTQVTISRTDRESLPESTLNSLLDGSRPVVIQPIDDDHIAGYGLLYSINNEPIGILKTQLTRDVWQQGQDTIQLLAIVLLGTGIIISVVTYLALDRLVVSRVTSLSANVDAIQSDGDLSKVLPVDANDEISLLSTNINQMLAKLNLSQQELHGKNLALQKAMHEVMESARLKTEFLSVMSHELRTPLNAIIGYSGIMLNGINGELDDEATRMVGNIFYSSKHLLNLVNDILDLSKIDAGRLELVDEPYDIRALVNQLDAEMRVLAEQKSLDFTIEIGADVPEAVYGDRERIKQILINLLSNAFKFTEIGSVTLAICKQESTLRIEVGDTGIGIPAHALSYIFDDFRQVDGSTRRTQRGTGLGLSIARKLVTAMKGRVTVTSEVGVGSTFVVVLPLKIDKRDTLSLPVSQPALS